MGKRHYPPRDLSDEALKRLVRLHSGEARKSDWADFTHWRSQSPDHEAAAVEAEALWSDAANLHRDPKTGLVKPGKKKGRPSRRTVLGIAGAGAAAAGGLWLSDAFRQLTSDYATGVAETRVIDLPDGSRVHLNALSAIDVDFTIGRRRITLIEGQAYFQVAADAARPFEVTAGSVEATALGTAFDANRNLPNGDTAIVVTEHAVRIRTARDQSITLKEGEKIVVSGDGRLGPVRAEDRAVAIAWQSGQYVAESRPLAEVVTALRAYHSGWIIIEDERLRDLRVNAVLDLKDPNASLAALAAGLPIRVRQISPFFIVISAA